MNTILMSTRRRDVYESLPRSGGVYVVMAADEFVYVGSTANLYKRLQNHQGWHDFLGCGADRLLWQPYDLKVNRDMVELFLIKSFWPKVNVAVSGSTEARVRLERANLIPFPEEVFSLGFKCSWWTPQRSRFQNHKKTRSYVEAA